METPFADLLNSPWPYVIAFGFVLGVAMLIFLLMDAFSDDSKHEPLTLREAFSRENRLLSNRQFLAVVGVIGLANWLLWIWLRIPADSRGISPMLDVVNLWGFAVVALPASFLIGMVGLQLASKSREI